MHTVVELPEFIRRAKVCDMSADEIDNVIDALAKTPDCGDPLVGTGGFRKWRSAGRGKGKSGGFRVVSFFSGAALPVFLITVFSKSEKENLSHAERNALKSLGKEIVSGFRSRVVPVRRSK